MKYTLSNEINSALSHVAQKIIAPEGAKEWTEGLQNIEQVAGQFGEVGSKRKLHYLFNNKEMIITESILEQNLPYQIKFTYDSKMGRNIVELKFDQVSDNKVRQTSHTTMELKGMMKWIGFIVIPMFKNQSRKYMTAFKSYAEQ